jgi:hypothetical protein
MTWVDVGTTFGYSPPARRPAIASHDLNAEWIASDSAVLPSPTPIASTAKRGAMRFASFAPQALSGLRQSPKPNPHSRDR